MCKGDSFELLPDDTIIVDDPVEIRNGNEKQYGKVIGDEGSGFFLCRFGSEFDKESGSFPRLSIFSKFSLKFTP